MQPFPVTRIAHVRSEKAAPTWLIEDLWGDEAVGFIAGTPKAGKTWLALELAVAVASGRPCLGRHAVRKPGHVLLYAAEDTAAGIKHRVASIAKARGLDDIERLAIGLITVPDLRLDADEHQQRLAATLADIKPRMLILDPLVRLHRGDENSAADVSSLLGCLRQLQRQHSVAIVLVHHIRKSPAMQPGQSLRGSGDLHAWSDSSLYLLRRRDAVELQAEHRAHPSPRPMQVELRAEPAMHLHVTGEAKSTGHTQEDQLAARALKALADEPMNRAALREALGVRNERLGNVLAALEADGRIARSGGVIVPVPDPK